MRRQSRGMREAIVKVSLGYEIGTGEPVEIPVERIVSMWLLENEDRVAMLGIRLPSLKDQA
jgi:hypothetical protein